MVVEAQKALARDGRFDPGALPAPTRDALELPPPVSRDGMASIVIGGETIIIDTANPRIREDGTLAAIFAPDKAGEILIARVNACGSSERREWWDRHAWLPADGGTITQVTVLGRVVGKVRS